MLSHSTKRRLRKCFVIPQRFVAALMSFSSVALAYMLRVSLTFALTQIVILPLSKDHIKDADVCHFDDVVSNNSSLKSGNPDSDRYDWDQALQGLILSSFYWGYIITHVPGGVLAQKFGGKRIMILAMITNAVFSILTPLAIVEGGWGALMVCRVFVGVGEGFLFPACNVLLAAWTPLKERSTTVTIVYSGIMLGSVCGSFISGELIHAFGWTSVFYWFGTLTLIWCFICCFIVYDDPDSHPFIKRKEKKYLRREMGQIKRNDKLSTPWKAMLTSAPLMALVIAQVGHSWGLFIIVNGLPKYMNDVLQLPIKKNGLYSSLPYAAMWMVASVTGFFSDFIIQRKCISITNARKLFTNIAAVGPAVLLVLATYSGCNRTLSILCFTIGMGFMGTYYAGIKANTLDLSPNFAGITIGIANGLGALTGVIGPYTVGLLTPNTLLAEWKSVFWLTFGILIFSAVVYQIFASGEIQPWNTPKSIDTRTIGADSVSEVQRITDLSTSWESKTSIVKK